MRWKYIEYNEEGVVGSRRDLEKHRSPLTKWRDEDPRNNNII